jgi:hypothetical protein
MLTSRPVFLVGVVDRFALVMANDLQDKDLAKARRPEFNHRSWAGPVLVGGKLPKDADERSRVFSELLQGGSDLEAHPEYYVAYTEISTELLKHGTYLSHWGSSLHPQVKAALAYVRQHRLDPDQTLVFPLRARDQSAALLIHPVNHQPWYAFDFDPNSVRP